MDNFNKFKKELRETIDGKCMVRKSSRDRAAENPKEYDIHTDVPSPRNKEVIQEIAEKYGYKTGKMRIQSGFYGFIYNLTAS